MKTFRALYRYREPSPFYTDGDLKATTIKIMSYSLKDAKRTAKNMEGQDGKTWLMEVIREVENV